ncbi:MAG: tyrosine-type recombinase/integrase [Candidatus Thorarchaeota archaeon]|jgi:integrase
MEKLDIHNTKNGLKAALKFLKKSSMSEEQKKKLLRLVEELQIGKASKKKVGNHRIICYIHSWIKLHKYFKKDFDKLTDEETEKFYKDLDGDKIKRKNGKPYKPSSKQEFIKALKKYLRWKLPEQKYYKLVGWIKEYKEVPDMRAITLKEAKLMVKKFKSSRDKTLFIFLFDSGCRIEEALNLRIKNIEKKKREKGKGYQYLVDIKFSKTLPRRISVPIAQSYLTNWLKNHPERNNPEAFLFPIGYDAVRKMLRVASKKVLEFSVTPHQLRHSSATFYSTKINNPVLFCYRFGWKFGSKEANRYIDRSLLGDEEQEKLTHIIEHDELLEQKKRIEALEKQNKMFKEFSDGLMGVLFLAFKQGLPKEKITEVKERYTQFKKRWN